MLASIRAIVGSTNQVKLNAVKSGILSLNSSVKAVEVIPFSYTPNIAWKSNYAIGQPFGKKQTAFGAIDRVRNCWDFYQKNKPKESSASTYMVALENGLIHPMEVGKSEEVHLDAFSVLINHLKNCWNLGVNIQKPWLDICYVAVRSSDPGAIPVIKRGQYVETNFNPAEKGNQESFDEAVKQYEQEIMPEIHQGKDLYLNWTKDLPGGPKRRGDFLQDCVIQAFKEHSYLEKAGKIVSMCAEAGMTASAGLRYGSMLWTRDLAYMAPVYLAKGYYDKFVTALKSLRDAQFTKHESYNNGYFSFDRFGNIPIVCIPKENERKFLLQRLIGSPEEPAFERQLKEFVRAKNPEMLKEFKDGTIEDLRAYYHKLLSIRKQLVESLPEKGESPPSPSFALQAFFNGNLADLTPGTRDSEIHYIRAIISALKQDPSKKMDLLIKEKFGESIAKALFYLYTNVIDPKDGLPCGADSRDIFADILYDAKTLTNAVFLYEALQGLSEYACDLDQTSFRSTLTLALAELKDKENIPATIQRLTESDLKTFLTQELKQLKTSIESKLLFNKGKFEVRDFIPGTRASIALNNPVTPTPIASIIQEHNPAFITGKTPDPQSLAIAVLAGLIPKEHYKDIFQCFLRADSKIGVQVFVPISGKTSEEALLLSTVKGQVVWPHVTWSVVMALIKMEEEPYLNMAEEQRDKLMQLGGCSEWYAIDPESETPVAGGDPLQGWAASAMQLANQALYDYYSLNA